MLYLTTELHWHQSVYELSLWCRHSFCVLTSQEGQPQWAPYQTRVDKFHIHLSIPTLHHLVLLGAQLLDGLHFDHWPSPHVIGHSNLYRTLLIRQHLGQWQHLLMPGQPVFSNSELA